MGFVYAIKHKRLSPIKIGVTNSESVFTRVDQFNTMSPYGVELIYCIKVDNPYHLETIIHRELKDYRLNGEWFDIDDIFLKEILKRHDSEINSNNEGFIKNRIKGDIPFNFDHMKYSVEDLEIFRKFFNNFKWKQDFDFELVKNLIGIETSVEIALEKYTEYQKIWNT